MSTPITDTYTEALTWTIELHRDQLRKGRDTPYIAHLLSVSALVLEAGGGEDLAVAALLHDALEDAPTTREARERRDEIQRRFGPEVLRVVEGCSDADPHEKDTMAWRDRKLRYIRHLKDDPDLDTLHVSLCDKLHNARAILRDYRRRGEAVWDRFTGKREGSLSYYRTLHGLYRARADELGHGFRGYVDELGRVLEELPEGGEVWRV